MKISPKKSISWINFTTIIICFQILTTYAVHEGVFKTCDEAGFCKRNRHLGSNIKQSHSFKSPYSIESNSIKANNNGENGNLIFNGNIIKVLPDLSKRNFPFEISLLEGNNIRLKVDEEYRNFDNLPIKSSFVTSKRYNETGGWAFKSGPLPYLSFNDGHSKISHNDDSLIIEYGLNFQYKAELSFYPIKLTISKQNEVQFVLNDEQFINIEHFRSRDDDPKNHLSNVEIGDNMFHDDFKDSRNDRLPIGPESIGLDFKFKNFQNVFGIPEHADKLNLKDTTHNSIPYRLYNVDIFEYETESTMPMYGSIPFMLATKPELSMGLFWINSADTFIDIDKTNFGDDTSTHWISENGIIDIMIFIGDKPSDINESYGLITGNVGLPQIFSLGYHQCRWNYNDEQDVLSINKQMDENQIPYDTIWLDIEYADQKKYFTWQGEKFPDPERMLAELDHTGRNLVLIIDPHIKTNYFVSNELIKNKITINDPVKNQTFVGKCWPGESIWIDTLNPSSQSYWDKKHELSTSNEFFGKLSTNIYLWNDMNEPSVFEGPETTSPRDLIHYGNWEHRSIHNIFGLTMHEATYESFTKRLQNQLRQRPFILTRSHFSGSQRTAAMWTGDNQATWEYLQISIPMVLSSNVAGMPFAGADVGGFFGNPSSELLTRWYQVGIWYPFFRAHAHIDTKRREPWVPGDPYTSIIRNALKLRYSLLPEFYNSFYVASKNGNPVMKPLFYEHVENTETYSIDDQFFLGDSGLMIKPITEEDTNEVNVYFPDSNKYYVYNGGNITQLCIQLEKPGYVEFDITLNDIPIFLKGGSILSQKNRYRRSSKLMKYDPYTLIVALDDQRKASGFLYIDDGESFNYEKDEYLNIKFNYDVNKLTGFVEHGETNQFSESIKDVEIEKIIILGDDNYTKSINIKQDNMKVGKIEQDGKNLIIKRPKIKVNQGWEILFDKSDDNTNYEHDEL